MTTVWRAALEDKSVVVMPTVPFPMSLTKTGDDVFDVVEVISSLMNFAGPIPKVADRRFGCERRFWQQKWRVDVRSHAITP